ncbi:hypothetical protein PMG11_02202 [Penicillium brasilianum]|uniref:Peptidase A1 domain-containing protein n=1 Tax=Penicillium brasilianum TaxID=104259 RepID=A0A0F7THH6_PENBI|nr:hypothetical protein PMG11_02202 [Penicillium brasilianum]
MDQTSLRNSEKPQLPENGQADEQLAGNNHTNYYPIDVEEPAPAASETDSPPSARPYCPEMLIHELARAPKVRWDPQRWTLERAVVSAGTTGVDSVIVPLFCDVKNNATPVNYRIELQVGHDPDHRFHVQVDSGSSVLWLRSRLHPDEELKPLDLPALDVFLESINEVTPRPLQPYKLSYGSGSQVELKMHTAPITLGNLSVEQMFGAVPFRRLSPTMPSGILGLGFSVPDSPLPHHVNLVLQMHKAGLVKHASFAMIGPRSEPASNPLVRREGERTHRGWFVLGALDDKYHRGITWCPIQTQNGEHRKWVVPLRKVIVNGIVVCENQRALLDTGCTYLLTGVKNMAALAEAMRGTRTLRGVEYTPGALRSVEFVFGNNDEDNKEASFGLNPENLTLGCGVEDTTMQRSPFESFKDGRLEDQHSAGDYWILGGIFLDNMITIFDYMGSTRVGFAAKSDIDPR